MSYESRIYVVKTNARFNWNEKPYGSKIAIFDLCNMGSEKYNGVKFTELFDKENDCSIYADDENTELIEDNYGDKLSYTTDINKVINWIEASEADDSYRRAELFLNFLKALNKQIEFGKWDGFNNIRLVHFGY